MYQIYPTLIDSFRYFIQSEEMTVEEMIDRINRKPAPPSIPMLKGRCFNDLIDNLLAGKALEVEPIILNGERFDCYNQRIVTDAAAMTFTFRKDICEEIVQMVQGSVSQIFTSSKVKTSYGEVFLYGYADYLKGDTCFELKTGGNYDFPKFLHNFQHKAYLYSLRKEGYKTDRVVYIYTDFSSVWTEDYYWLEEMEDSIVSDLEHFISFLEAHKDLITDKKIFSLT